LLRLLDIFVPFFKQTSTHLFHKIKCLHLRIFNQSLPNTYLRPKWAILEQTLFMRFSNKIWTEPATANQLGKIPRKEKKINQSVNQFLHFLVCSHPTTKANIPGLKMITFKYALIRVRLVFFVYLICICGQIKQFMALVKQFEKYLKIFLTLHKIHT
jgi:hypothetical protein